MNDPRPTDSGSGLAAYTILELRRVFRERMGSDLPPGSPRVDRFPEHAPDQDTRDTVIIGTVESSAPLQQLIGKGFLEKPVRPQGYSMRGGPHPANPRRWVLAIAGADPAGALYALRDLEHYCLHAFHAADGRLTVQPFERHDHPRIEYRGHWVWGCNMPDKAAWIDNMSRWKLNELIHWDNYPPPRAREYVTIAHERGVRVVWGFGWGWAPDWNFDLPADFDRGCGQGVEMCGSSETNRRFFEREILRKIREDYAPTGCDGVYFQSFTECPKCQCPRCANRTMGELMLHFVNPIVDAIKREYPDLWISCGIHHDFGDFAFLKDLDPRCNIYWENCESGTSLRGADEDFGYIYKSIPYGHGYGKTCPSDPPYTEESLQEWARTNAAAYVVAGGPASHYQYMQFLQNWGRRFLAKRSPHKHASLVADHSLFCRRTPFPHAALAEAQWNPNLDTVSTVDSILTFLNLREAIQSTPDPDIPMRDPAGKPPWLCATDPSPEGPVTREGHTE